MTIKRHKSLNIHPGQILRDLVIDPEELTIGKASEYLKTTRLTLSNIVNGKSGITPNMAIKISRVFGGKAEFWIRLQRDYDLLKAEEEFQEDLKEYAYENH